MEYFTHLNLKPNCYLPNGEGIYLLTQDGERWDPRTSQFVNCKVTYKLRLPGRPGTKLIPPQKSNGRNYDQEYEEMVKELGKDHPTVKWFHHCNFEFLSRTQKGWYYEIIESKKW